MRLKSCLTILALVATLCAVGACNSENDKVTAEDVQKKASEALDTAMAYSKQQQQELMAQFDEQYAQMKDKAAVMMDQAAEQAARGKQQAKQVFEDLKARQEVVNQKMQALKNAGADGWQQAKQELAEAIDALAQSMQQASAELRQ